jgi:hypothetical protein
LFLALLLSDPGLHYSQAAKAEINILSVPTHRRTVFVHLGISLSFVPIAILFMPLNSSANAPKAIGGRSGDNGKTITTIARAMIRGPSPILTSFADLFWDGNAIPTAILSDPIISRTAELSRIVVCVVIPG